MPKGKRFIPFPLKKVRMGGWVRRVDGWFWVLCFGSGYGHRLLDFLWLRPA